MSHPVIRTDGRSIVLDLSTGAAMFGEPVSDRSVDELSSLIDRAMREAGTAFAFGRWAEPRELYRTDQFAGDGEPRTVHLGIDLFCPAGTPVCAPLDATVVHIANNALELDYGPLLILRHDPGGAPFHTLYGHLSTDTLARWRPGDRVEAGAEIARVGSPPGNGNWPPHLHFQVIRDLQGLGTDFPGVAAASELDKWLELSPSPAEFFPEHHPNELEYAQ